MANSQSTSGSFIFRSSIFWSVWLLFFATALAYYFRWNEPIRRAALNLQPLAVSLGYIVALCGLGYPLTRVLLPKQDRWIQLLSSLAFGIGLTGILSFELGSIGYFDPKLFLFWYVLGLVLFAIAMLRWRPNIEGPPVWNVWSALAVSIFALFLGQSIPFLVAPEVSNDALAYHLLVPKLYLSHGMVYHITLMVAAYYPSLAEYNYLPLLMLSDEIVCKCFHFWIGIAVLLAMARIIKKVSPSVRSALGPAFFLAMPVTAIYVGWAWNDFLYTLFVLLSLFFLLNYHLAPPEERSGRDFLLAGIMAGLASWTKYTFVLFFFTIVLMLLWGWRKWKWETKHYWLFFLGIAFVAPFWLLQNWMFTQNPVYPFLNQIFQSPYWTEASNQHFIRGLREYEIREWGWSSYLLFPFHVTLKPRVVDTHTGILPLVFIPLLFLRTSSKGLSFLKGFIGACVLVWLFIHTENRSLFSVFAVLLCVASVVLQELQWPNNRLRSAFVAFIILAVTSNLFMTMLTTYYLFDPVGYFLGRENKSLYISKHAPSQPAFDYLNSKPEVGRVVLVSMHHPYYLNRSSFFSSFSDPPIAEVLSFDTQSSQEIARKYRRLDITHIVINRPAYDREHSQHLYSWSPDKKRQFEEFLFTYCAPVARFGNDYVFRLQAEE